MFKSNVTENNSSAYNCSYVTAHIPLKRRKRVPRKTSQIRINSSGPVNLCICKINICNGRFNLQKQSLHWVASSLSKMSTFLLTLLNENNNKRGNAHPPQTSHSQRRKKIDSITCPIEKRQGHCSLLSLDTSCYPSTVVEAFFPLSGGG